MNELNPDPSEVKVSVAPRPQRLIMSKDIFVSKTQTPGPKVDNVIRIIYLAIIQIFNTPRRNENSSLNSQIGIGLNKILHTDTYVSSCIPRQSAF